MAAAKAALRLVGQCPGIAMRQDGFDLSCPCCFTLSFQGRRLRL